MGFWGALTYSSSPYDPRDHLQLSKVVNLRQYPWDPVLTDSARHHSFRGGLTILDLPFLKTYCLYRFTAYTDLLPTDLLVLETYCFTETYCLETYCIYRLTAHRLTVFTDLLLHRLTASTDLPSWSPLPQLGPIFCSSLERVYSERPT